MLSSVLLPLVVGVLATSACPPPPIATLFLLDDDVEPIGDVGVTKLDFNMSKSSPKPSFLLHCAHSSPIRWVLDEDLVGKRVIFTRIKYFMLDHNLRFRRWAK